MDVLPENIKAERTDPAELLEQRERDQNLWATARKLLNEDQLAALWLYYVEELSTAQVAKVLGRTRVSIKVMLYRARGKLEPYLVAQNSDEKLAIPAGGLP